MFFLCLCLTHSVPVIFYSMDFITFVTYLFPQVPFITKPKLCRTFFFPCGEGRVFILFTLWPLFAKLESFSFVICIDHFLIIMSSQAILTFLFLLNCSYFYFSNVLYGASVCTWNCHCQITGTIKPINTGWLSNQESNNL